MSRVAAVHHDAQPDALTSTRSRADICIIGAGSSGVTAAKALKERGIAFDCFEKGSNIGGMWRYENDNGMSSAYRSLHIDTSRKNLGYSDFPIPDDKPDFLSHWEVAEYLDAYANHFDVRRHITFRTEVTDVSPLQEQWEVTLGSGERRRYASVLVANGHLWDPRWPTFPGRFDGITIHSHSYRTADPFVDKNVLVVGIGTRRSTLPWIYAGAHAASIFRRVAVLGCDRILFTDGSTVPFDAAIYATGYKTTLPFLQRGIFEVRDNQVALYRRTLPPDRPGLFFVGLLQPIGATIPLVEIQSRWIAAVLGGDVKLPERQTMDAEIARHRRALTRRYVNSARYTLEVDYREYAKQLRGDMRRGKAG